MIFRRLNSRCRVVALSFTKLAVVLAAVLIEVGAARAIDFTIGAPEVIYTKSQRKSRGGSYWPDGNLGVVGNGNGTFDFYGANASKSVLTTGTLTDPGASKRSVSITGVPKKTYGYLAGGPVYEDPYSGARLMVYHAEIHHGSAKSFYSVLGMAVSTDLQHRTFRDLGEIIRPNLPPGVAEVGGGSFAVVDGHFNVYYKEWLADGSTAEVAVARAPMAELMTNALAGQSTAFSKYYNGSWSQPGLGGLASYVETVNPNNSWLSVSYNKYLDQVVMVSSQWSGDGGDLYITTSPDGINWAPRQPIAVDPGEQFYPSIIGAGDDPTRTEQSFYVYYTDSLKGAWNRWSDAQLRRREIVINSPGSIDPSDDSLGYTAEWVPIGDYQSDFQGGSPAEGWTYAWNPKGKLGKSAAYIPLLWSDSAQAYNTTGAATTIPSRKTHPDDFLSFTDDGGHPGLRKYMPMAGYTIQADDGAGLYRIVDSSIQKSNSSLFTKEDGLQVLVYVNDTRLGAGQSVLTDGSLTGFDRYLGTLNVGDTVWVMINPLKNQIEDAFTSFDFSLEKLVYSAQNLQPFAQLRQSSAVPEPGAGALVLAVLAVYRPRRRR
ncbi:MAG: hypothetical protein L0228_05285 [Planctomycetes bacterium]|nr:hypothetical protein [Planctomycetota bacterium]